LLNSIGANISVKLTMTYARLNAITTKLRSSAVYDNGDLFVKERLN